MRLVRQIHLYLGCLFAPLLIYFAISGAWQVFRFNDLPKNETPSETQKVLHALSGPHKSSTLPGLDPKKEQSFLFSLFAFVMAIGLATTTALGIVLAIRFGRNPVLAYGLLFSGFALPVLFLLIHS